MPRSVRIAGRLLTLVALVASLAVLATGPSSQSPYLSALSDLAATTASAAPPACNNKMCTAGPRLSFKCISASGMNCTSDHFDCSNSVC